MQAESTSSLVSAEWLASRMTLSSLVLLDASFFLPAQNRSARDEYAKTHIPGARFFDIDAVADRQSSLPHMLPTAEVFADAVGELGVSNKSDVIVYDSNYFMASARVWWTFRVFGHERVAVLDGGLNRWLALGLPVEGFKVETSLKRYEPRYRTELVRDLESLRSSAPVSTFQLLDARSPGRFSGLEPEPRSGLRSGHIPGSRNVFFRDLIDEPSCCLKTPDILARRFANIGIDPTKPVVTTCGTGVTAAILAFALYQLGNRDVAVYDGSWTEWGAREDTSVETGDGN